MTATQPQLWHQQAWESESQHQAFTYYRDMPLPRSVDGAYRRYYAVKRGLQAGDGQVAQKRAQRAPGGWQNWSRGCKWDGKPQPGAVTWEERTRAYDAHMDTLLDAELEAEMVAARRQLIRDEITDYSAQLGAFRDVFEKTPIQWQEVRYIEEEDPEGQKTGRILKVTTTELNASGWLQLSRWRQLISQQGRLALKLPDRIQQQQLTGSDGGPIQVTWVDPLDEDDDIGIGADELPNA